MIIRNELTILIEVKINQEIYDLVILSNLTSYYTHSIANLRIYILSSLPLLILLPTLLLPAMHTSLRCMSIWPTEILLIVNA